MKPSSCSIVGLAEHRAGVADEVLPELAGLLLGLGRRREPHQPLLEALLLERAGERLLDHEHHPVPAPPAAPGRCRRSCSSARRPPRGRRRWSPLLSDPSPRHPDLLAGPLLRPAAMHEVAVLLGGAVRRIELVQRLDLEARVAQERDALAVRLVEVGPVLGPLDPLEARAAGAAASPRSSSSLRRAERVEQSSGRGRSAARPAAAAGGRAGSRRTGRTRWRRRTPRRRGRTRSPAAAGPRRSRGSAETRARARPAARVRWRAGSRRGRGPTGRAPSLMNHAHQ